MRTVIIMTFCIGLVCKETEGGNSKHQFSDCSHRGNRRPPCLSEVNKFLRKQTCISWCHLTFAWNCPESQQCCNKYWRQGRVTQFKNKKTSNQKKTRGNFRLVQKISMFFFLQCEHCAVFDSNVDFCNILGGSGFSCFLSCVC